MYVSSETPEQTEKRLRSVIAACEYRKFDGSYIFEELPAGGMASLPAGDALAYVRDEDVWSRLVPSRGSSGELFAIAGFHFPPGLDNSGFVGWLATHMKRSLGTGVFVVCGQNSARGGIFDYWGCPYAIRDSFFREIEGLIESEKSEA